MPRSHPLEPPLDLAMPSITATEFAAWLIAPKSIGPCPWLIGQAEPSAPLSRRCVHGGDEALTDILAILGEIEP